VGQVTTVVEEVTLKSEPIGGQDVKCATYGGRPLFGLSCLCKHTGRERTYQRNRLEALQDDRIEVFVLLKGRQNKQVNETNMVSWWTAVAFLNDLLRGKGRHELDETQRAKAKAIRQDLWERRPCEYRVAPKAEQCGRHEHVTTSEFQAFQNEMRERVTKLERQSQAERYQAKATFVPALQSQKT
jgi:hypothetical protein